MNKHDRLYRRVPASIAGVALMLPLAFSGCGKKAVSPSNAEPEQAEKITAENMDAYMLELESEISEGEAALRKEPAKDEAPKK